MALGSSGTILCLQWPAPGVVGSQRDQRDCQRQLLPEHPQAHQGWSRNQEACRCPLQVQLDLLILQFRSLLVLAKLSCVHCVGLPEDHVDHENASPQEATQEIQVP